MINATAGTITELTINITQSITPEQCVMIGEHCIKNLLCKVTDCIIFNSTIYINWIW